jgi:hypothetical protein
MDAAGPTVAALFLVCHNSAGKQIARDFTKNVGVKEGETWSVGASVVMVGAIVLGRWCGGSSLSMHEWSARLRDSDRRR